MITGHSLKLHPKKILLPVDFSPSSDTALLTATEFAQHFQAELILLNIIPMMSIASADQYSTDRFPQQDFLNEARKRSLERLTTEVHHLAGMGVTALPFVETGNDVVGNIMMVIERERTDMIIISTHGLSGWRSVVFGSIAEKVIRLVECPVLLLRTPKSE